MKKGITILNLALILVFLFQERSDAYRYEVHELITKNVIRSMNPLGDRVPNLPKLNIYINDYTGMAGVAEKVNKSTVEDWMVHGSKWEDLTFLIDPNFKIQDLLTSHFHNPLTNKGYTVAGVEEGESAYDRANNADNLWSWKNARDYLYAELTAMNKSEREQALSACFDALGHLMHLVQDMAVPAHTRNDLHGFSETYEAYTKDKRTKLKYTSAPFPYWNISMSPHAPKQFWDLDVYNGTITYNNSAFDNGGYIGLAEYTNANFLSKDTIFDEENFPHPSKQNTNYYDFGLLPFVVITTPDKINLNAIPISGYGKTWLAALRYWGEEILGSSSLKKYTRSVFLNDECHKEYAQDLIPRAVGYSAGLLDYFFRGQFHIEVLAPSVDQLHVSDSYGSYFGNRDDLGTDIKNVAVVLQNNSKLYDGTSEPAGPGTLTLTIGYTDTSTGSMVYQTAGTASVTGEIPVVGTQKVLSVVFPLAQPIPAQRAKDLTYYFAFMGKLGQEEGAVIGRVVKAPVLYSVSPDQATEGTPVILTGDNLPDPADQPNTKGVCFSADLTKPYSVELISRTETEITVKVPNTAGLEKPGYGGLRVKNVLERSEGEETLEEIIYSNPVSFFPIAEGEIVNYGKFLIDAHVEATKPILGDYNQLPRPISYPVLPGDRVLIQLMTGFTYHVTGGTTDGTVDIEVLTPEAIDFSIGVQ